MKFVIALAVGMAIMCAWFAIFITSTETANSANITTYQGKDATWWAKRAQQARKDANARRNTIKRLKHTIRYSSSIQECVHLATIAYPRFTESRAWQIIYHESWRSGKQFAKNRHSTASGLYQFLTSTWASTPYSGTSIWSPCASSLAAGWMHQNGRGGEWAIK